jgi:hypothetical protein
MRTSTRIDGIFFETQQKTRQNEELHFCPLLQLMSVLRIGAAPFNLFKTIGELEKWSGARLYRSVASHLGELQYPTVLRTSRPQRLGPVAVSLDQDPTAPGRPSDRIGGWAWWHSRRRLHVVCESPMSTHPSLSLSICRGSTLSERKGCRPKSGP